MVETESGPIKLFTEQTMLPINSLTPNDWNPNEMDPKKFELLREEIKLYGWVGNPLVVRVKPLQLPSNEKHVKTVQYEIIDGEHRWRAGKEEGMINVPCIILEIDPKDEASFRTYVLNNFRGEINEVKLAVLVKNWHAKGFSANSIYNRIGLRGHKQRALIDSLKPKDMSKKAFSGAGKGQHRSFAVILTLDEDETVHRAIKLTRLHDQAECLMAIVDYYLDHHILSNEHVDSIQKLLEVANKTADAEGLTQLCKYFLEHVTKEDIRKDDDR